MSEQDGFINIKLNLDWHTITTDSDAAAVNEICKYWSGREVYEFFSIPASEQLWRECDDGMGDEMIAPDGEEYLIFWDGDRLYTAARGINDN